MERADVAIVGGGPAGMAAAHAAAEAGADAVVVEKGVPRADREGLGPDSTDAAGMLDYWVDIMGIDPGELPEDVILQELSGARFVGPTERCTLRDTGMDSSYPNFGFTFQRARMDDWMRERAEASSAAYRVGTGVRRVESDTESHVLHLADGSEIEAGRMILADGPQRTVTMGVLDRLLPEGKKASEVLGPRRANHIAYQEHRRMPPELFEEDVITFWWGLIPGKTAYPWIFPNDDGIARIGLTMPIGMDIEAVENREAYDLLRPEDERIPTGGAYIRRLLEREFGDEYDVETDFPLVEERGKRGGVESYPISSTRPIDSPTDAGIAVAGGAMGTTSAFHEGGYHVAVRSGAIAGDLAARGRLDEYNEAWKAAIGDEILRNVSMADVVADYEPADWDRTFRTIGTMLEKRGGGPIDWGALSSGLGAAKFYTSYRKAKFRYRKGRYVQLSESDYRY
ncbi:NAD(P)/FAD-dependent oxidoreductase [Natronorarus salvus]|uniref:NAD(P)/FAD-dependent oxidoreductase n=1 Tax=Natronorarus salvus TaxID=3117733 RepID=UPI002F263451